MTCPSKIYVNQVGYLTGARKKAIIVTPASRFYVNNLLGYRCYEGKVRYDGLDQNSGDLIYVADFSEFTMEGEYYLSTKEGETSLPFRIGNSLYEPVLFDTMRAFYYLRCGCELSEAYSGEYNHKECHIGHAVLWEDRTKEKEVTGGWHDAGDYGRYVTAGACAVAHLLYAFLLFPKALNSLDLNLADSAEELPDILTECKYELQWLLKMQREDGAVYHKVTTAHHAPFIMPEEDQDQLYLFPVSSMATADFAAVCALGARVYEKFSPEFSETLLNAAKKAGDWLSDHPEFLGFRNPKGCNTGEYGETTDVDNRFWAWAELFAVTGEEEYHMRMKKSLEQDFALTEFGYMFVGGLGALSYVMSDRASCNESIKARFQSEFIHKAEVLKEIADRCGYGVAMEAKDFTWGSNMNVMKRGMNFIIGDWLEGENRFCEYAMSELHYLLGMNATGYSYVTGTGTFRCNHPHLRPAYADGVDECIPGMVSGGPNGHPCDTDARILLPEGTPPMKCYVDDVGCYSLNEITIYWNSPTVFVLAYACTSEKL